jgi:hypothetical protein
VWIIRSPIFVHAGCLGVYSQFPTVYVSIFFTLTMKRIKPDGRGHENGWRESMELKEEGVRSKVKGIKKKQ